MLMAKKLLTKDRTEASETCTLHHILNENKIKINTYFFLLFQPSAGLEMKLLTYDRGLSDWLIDYDGVRLASQNRGHHWPIVDPRDECERRAVLIMIPAGDNSWLVYQNSLAVLPAETSGASSRNGRRNENFAYSVPFIRQRIFNMP
jgi:hypothetical protein